MISFLSLKIHLDRAPNSHKCKAETLKCACQFFSSLTWTWFHSPEGKASAIDVLYCNCLHFKFYHGLEQNFHLDRIPNAHEGEAWPLKCAWTSTWTSWPHFWPASDQLLSDGNTEQASILSSRSQGKTHCWDINSTSKAELHRILRTVSATSI